MFWEKSNVVDEEYLDLGYDIEVEIFDKIDYEDTSFLRMVHCLVLAGIQ